MRFLLLLFVCTALATTPMVRRANFCDPSEACNTGCKKLLSGIFRFPFLISGKCVNYGGAKDHCQCKYEGVNIPCTTTTGKCPPSNASVNLCDATVACDWACENSYKGTYGDCIVRYGPIMVTDSKNYSHIGRECFCNLYEDEFAM